ncbi:MAG: hypothetical protein C5B52_18595 [Bacteroidetes bacterium]|nr:MAG: hypothetical protein C5B52_18595 [Bacteroidota bacterium]
MEYKDFIDSLKNSESPKNMSIYLQALWEDGKKNWDRAHELIQDVEDENASWIHAYLHRKEGDAGNALYWYNRARKKMPNISLDEEWKFLVENFLKE